jgi:hypothetical protein
MSDTPNPKQLPPHIAAAAAAAAAVAAARVVPARSSEYRSIYTNVFKTRVGVNEVATIFGYLTDQPGAPIANVWQEEACVIMSWSQVKTYAKFLSEIVAAAEEYLGPIPISELTVAKDIGTTVRKQLEAFKIHK